MGYYVLEIEETGRGHNCTDAPILIKHKAYNVTIQNQNKTLQCMIQSYGVGRRTRT